MADAGVRTLLLLRHAKSSWKDELPDAERPLNPRGRRDARAAGQLLVGTGAAPDLVYCSPAVRTRQTWDALAEAGVRADDVAYRDEIYEASVDALLDLVGQTPDAVRTLLLIGHAPSLPGLAELLAGDRSDADARARMHADYPTSALAELQLDGPWVAATAGAARLTAFAVPRG